MPDAARDLIVDPETGTAFSWQIDAAGEGSLLSAAGRTVPVRGGIPRFVPDDGYVESFGFQWNTFDVRRKVEDEATFAVKTGVEPTGLRGLTVLDAGCGGGRYTRVAVEHGAIVAAADLSRAVEKAKS